jgi:hypothetical protein
MNKVAAISLASAGGLMLFSVAYLGFAKMNHVPMHTLPVFGSLFPAPPDGEDEHGPSSVAEHGDEPYADPNVSDGHDAEATSHDAPPSEKHAPAPSKHGEAKADLLGMFQFESPYTAEEMRELVETLERKNAELDRRMAQLATKEELVDDRLETIEERQKALDAMKAELEELQSELAARAEELDREGETKADEEKKSVKALGALFEDGEVDALATRLVGYGPREAAKILATLEPDRAKELLDAIPQAKWREFAEAYTKTAAAQKTK